MKKITIYHGSENIIKTPQYHFGNPKMTTAMDFTAQRILNLQKNGDVPKKKTALQMNTL